MATALTDNWTEMNCLKLIREFRARPSLWDKKDQFYYKKALKPLLWEEIGQKLEIPALDCKHKMNILMSSFRREKAKVMNKIKENNGDTSDMCIPWFAFKDMMFLMDKETERKRQQMNAENVDSDNEDLNESTSRIQRTLLKQRLQLPSSLINNKRPRLSDASQESEKQSSNSNATTSPKPLPKPQPVAETAPADDEEIKSFANFIAFKMRKYSETTKNKVQQAICDIIFKADQNFFEHNKREEVSSAKNNTNEHMSDEIKEEYDIDCYIAEENSD